MPSATAQVVERRIVSTSLEPPAVHCTHFVKQGRHSLMALVRKKKQKKTVMAVAFMDIKKVVLT